MQSVLSKKGKMPKPFECTWSMLPTAFSRRDRVPLQSKRIKTFHMLLPNATVVVKYTLKRKSKP